MIRHWRSTVLVVVWCFFAVSCSTLQQRQQNARVIADDGAYSVSSFLRSRGVPLSTLSDGTLRIENTPAVREALLAHQSLSRLRVDVIVNNIRNADVTRRVDGHSGPYLRQIVQLDGGGHVRAIVEDTRLPDRFLRYEPGHPDANSEGYVRYPNVDIVFEMADMVDVSYQLELSAELLRRFDPDLVLPKGVAEAYYPLSANGIYQ